jgi:hypothetical protein
MKRRSKTSLCCGVLLPDAVSWDCAKNPSVCLGFLLLLSYHSAADFLLLGGS